LEDYKAIDAASEYTKTIGKTMSDREDVLKEDRMSIERNLGERRSRFQDELIKVVKSIEKFQTYGSMRMLDDHLETLAELHKALQKHEVDAEDIHAKALAEAHEKIEPYNKLWHLVNDKEKALKKYLTSPLFSGDIAPEEVENEVQKMWRDAFKLKASFEQQGFQKPGNVATKIKTDLDQFKENVPLLHALCNPGLRERHWKEISQVVGFCLEPDPTFTLEKMLNFDIGTYVQEITEISDSAGKEYQIESSLDSQFAEWEPVIMEFKPWAQTGSHIVSGHSVDEVQTLLDDHVIKTQTMKGSPYAANFAERIDDWEEFLKGVQDIIDIWLKVQSVWLYLEPIFSSDDIMHQMPTEGALFREVDKTWKEIMAKCVAEPASLVVFKQEQFKERLESANDKLEQVQKGLNDYLETKRLFFPRFFFLSNDNLLEILSETKDPKRVNAHIKKAFEGIQSLYFEDDLKISQMISPEKEYVRLTMPVDPVAARGAVEVWLVQVEAAMIQSIRDICFASRDDYPVTPFVQWVQNWPGQVIIGIFNLYWTSEVNHALKTAGNAGLITYAGVLKGLLQEIVGLVRIEIPKLVRYTLEALIVIFVHNYDTVREMGSHGVEKADDFNWLVQLRYFIEENPDKPGVDDLAVRIMNSFLGYAYEYIGNCGRLIVTPLTDRCYRTCCGALHLPYGAAPRGPRGYGQDSDRQGLGEGIGSLLRCLHL